MMKLFLREHVALIIVQIIQFTIICGIFWLSGFRDVSIIFYSLFLSMFFLSVYLLYMFISRRNFYKRLSKKIDHLDDSQQELEESPISNALKNLLISQYNLYENEMIQLQNKQEEHFILLDRWIHQMKTPLSVIELMANELDEPESSDMREETDRMKSSLNTILHMARLRSFDRDFQVELVDVGTVIWEVSKENKRLFIRNRIYPEVSIEDNGIKVETDEKWFHFMLTQIIQNAVKYTCEHGEISVNLMQENQKVVLEIVDNGIGIPESDVRRIFDAFFTGENGRNHRESTGIGLYLVKEIVDQLGHQIKVESEVGKGSLFRIIF